MTVLFLKIEDVSVLPGALIRMFSNGMRARRASELLIKDLHFGEVPVRIYLPRSPSASKRRGVVLFHGGCGMYGSISKELAGIACLLSTGIQPRVWTVSMPPFTS